MNKSIYRYFAIVLTTLLTACSQNTGDNNRTTGGMDHLQHDAQYTSNAPQVHAIWKLPDLTPQRQKDVKYRYSCRTMQGNLSILMSVMRN